MPRRPNQPINDGDIKCIRCHKYQLADCFKSTRDNTQSVATCLHCRRDTKKPSPEIQRERMRMYRQRKKEQALLMLATVADAQTPINAS